MSDVHAPEPNPYSAPGVGILAREFARNRWDSDLAGFGRRCAAAAIDVAILTFGFHLFLVGLVVGLDNMFDPRDTSIWPGVVAISGLGQWLVLFVGYWVVMESSSWQATPGKLAMGVKVTDLNGERISFLRALGRFLGKLLSCIFLLGFLLAWFTEKQQALHDKIAGTLVLRER